VKKSHHPKKNLLKLRSEYFRAALDGTWEESTTRIVTLDEENSDVFNLFVHWLYYKEVQFNTSCDDDDTDILLVEAYLFAERRGCFAFQNDMVDNIAKWWGMRDKGFSAKAIMLMFTETTPSSKLRRFTAEKAAWEGKVEDMLSQSEDSIHPEFAIAFYKAFLERITIAVVDLSYAVWSGGSHNFRCNMSGCGKSPDMALFEGSSRRIAESDQAPYQDRNIFCDRYHVREEKKVVKVSKVEDGIHHTETVS